MWETPGLSVQTIKTLDTKGMVYQLYTSQTNMSASQTVPNWGDSWM